MRTTEYKTILDAAATTGAGEVINVEPYRNIVVAIATDGGGDAALTIKAQGSIEVGEPDFDSAQSASNIWDYIEMIDAEDGSSVAGDTGFSVSTADDYRLFNVNVDNLRWFTLNVTARAEGEATAKMMATSNW